MRDRHSRRERREQFVIMPVTTTGLVADREAIGQFFEHVHHLIHLPHLQLPLDFSIVIQNANENVLDVNVESNVQHNWPPEKRVVKQEHTTRSTIPDRRRLPT